MGATSMTKAVLIVVSDGFGGYGDFLFALKLSQELKKQFSKDSDTPPLIYIVTQDTGREKIRHLGGDVEFGVDILTPDELKLRVNSSNPNERLDVGEIFEGPVFKSELIEKINNALIGHSPVSLTMLPEYGYYQNSSVIKEHSYYRKKLKQIQLHQVLYSGFDAGHEEGIILTDSLTVPSEPTRMFQELDLEIKDIIGDIEAYQKTTELSMQYSHDKYSSKLTQHYLEVHREYYSQQNKNQDVLLVGTNLDKKRAALTKMKDQLIADGFQRITFYNTSTKTEDVIYDSGQPGKYYRGIYVRGMSHKSMIACTALSGPLMGATGDQSLGEALSANKVIIYETLAHKQKLIRHYNKEIIEQSKDDPNITELLTLLRSDKYKTINYQRLGVLLRDPSVMGYFSTLNHDVIFKKNLICTISRSSITATRIHITNLLKNNQINEALNVCDLALEKYNINLISEFTEQDLASYDLNAEAILKFKSSFLPIQYEAILKRIAPLIRSNDYWEINNCLNGQKPPLSIMDLYTQQPANSPNRLEKEQMIEINIMSLLSRRKSAEIIRFLENLTPPLGILHALHADRYQHQLLEKEIYKIHIAQLILHNNYEEAYNFFERTLKTRFTTDILDVLTSLNLFTPPNEKETYMKYFGYMVLQNKQNQSKEYSLLLKNAPQKLYQIIRTNMNGYDKKTILTNFICSLLSPSSKDGNLKYNGQHVQLVYDILNDYPQDISLFDDTMLKPFKSLQKLLRGLLDSPELMPTHEDILFILQNTNHLSDCILNEPPNEASALKIINHVDFKLNASCQISEISLLEQALDNQCYDVATALIRNTRTSGDIDILCRTLQKKDSSGQTYLTQLQKNKSARNEPVIGLACYLSTVNRLSQYKPKDKSNALRHQSFQELIKTYENTALDYDHDAFIGLLLINMEDIKSTYKQPFFSPKGQIFGNNLYKICKTALNDLGIELTQLNSESRSKYTAALTKIINQDPNLRVNIPILKSIAHEAHVALPKCEPMVSTEDAKDILNNHNQSNDPTILKSSPDATCFYKLNPKAIGQGNWGTVFQAEQYTRDQSSVPPPIAVKKMRIKDHNILTMEHRLFQKVYPSNYFDQFTDDKSSYLIMPLFQGVQLDKYLDSHSEMSLPLKDRGLMAVELLSDLAKMHEKGITHNDLKTKNILYDPAEHKIHIIDFGCAQDISKPDRLKYEDIDSSIFAFEFPPEYIDGVEANPALDVYAMTPILAEVLGIDKQTIVQTRLIAALTTVDNKLSKMIWDSFNQTEILGDAFFQTPLRDHIHEDEFLKFVKAYTNTQYDFSSYKHQVGPDVIKLLNEMQAHDPKKRPTAQECFTRLNQLFSYNSKENINKLRVELTNLKTNESGSITHTSTKLRF